tara:strand:- start:1802 stop:1981 length:180 start_codon:yes stop_codon:yes gene_type:complete
MFSASFRKFCKVPKIPAKIFTPPTTAEANDLLSALIKESIPTLAAPVSVDRIMTGIENE